MKKVQVFAYIYLAVIMLVGGVVVSYLLSQRSNLDFNMGVTSTVFGTLVGLLIAVVTSLIYKKKNGNIPPIDERSITIIKNYFSIVLYILLIGSGAILLTLFALGITTIDVGVLIVVLGAVYIVIIVGAFVVKHFC